MRGLGRDEFDFGMKFIVVYMRTFIPGFEPGRKSNLAAVQVLLVSSYH